MNKSWERATSGFGERGQEPFGDIPTEPEAFLRWGHAQLAAKRAVSSFPTDG